MSAFSVSAAHADGNVAGLDKTARANLAMVRQIDHSGTGTEAKRWVAKFKLSMYEAWGSGLEFEEDEPELSQA
jgi:hypothetical protein